MVRINGKDYKEIRCYRCQAWAINANIEAGIMCYQCPNCGFFNEWTFKYLKNKELQTKIDKEYTIESREEVKKDG